MTVDGNQKSGIHSPVEGKVVDIPLFTTGLENIPTVVGFGISGCHPQYVGLSGFNQLMLWGPVVWGKFQAVWDSLGVKIPSNHPVSRYVCMYPGIPPK